MPQHLKYRGPWLVAVLVTLFLGVPWYWPEDRALEGWLVPAWVWITLGASVMLSVVVVWGALRGWPDEDEY